MHGVLNFWCQGIAPLLCPATLRNSFRRNCCKLSKYDVRRHARQSWGGGTPIASTVNTRPGWATLVLRYSRLRHRVETRSAHLRQCISRRSVRCSRLSSLVTHSVHLNNVSLFTERCVLCIYQRSLSIWEKKIGIFVSRVGMNDSKYLLIHNYVILLRI